MFLGEAMHTLPIFGTVVRAYGFALGRFGTVLRLSWLWMAIYAAALFTWGPEVNAAMAKFQQTQDPTVVQDMLGQIFGLAIVQLLAQVIVMVALLRAVISQNYREGVPLHLFSGMPDLRVLGVILLLVIAFMAGAIGLAMVVGLVEAILTAAGAASALPILLLALYALIIWAGLRISLVMAVASVEPNLGVERSWELTKGNVLRLLVSIILLALPFVIVLGAVFFAVVVPAFGPLPNIEGLSQQDAQKAIQTYMMTVQTALQANWPVYVAVTTLLTLFGAGLQAGFFGHAYRSLNGMDDVG